MAENFQEWLQQGETLYQAALKDFHDLESQLHDLEAKIAAKQGEVNQIAQMIGKTPVESSRKSTQLATNNIIDLPERAPTGVGSNANIARALTGKFGR